MEGADVALGRVWRPLDGALSFRNNSLNEIEWFVANTVLSK